MLVPYVAQCAGAITFARRQVLESLETARFVVDTLSGKMGSDILLLDISEITIIADYFVIATAESERQLEAMATGVADEMEETKGIRALSVEGTAASGWILLDYGNIIVHLFDQVRRDRYQLEALWRDAHVIVRMA